MSTLRVNNLASSAGTGNIALSPDNNLYLPGSVVQVVSTRYDVRTTVTTNSAVGGEITGLRVNITPKFANSMIYCTFQVHGEGQATHDYMYLVFKNGAIAAGSYPGYNSEVGNLVYSGISQALPYESDYSSTPYTKTFFYIDYPGSTSPVFYAPAVRHSSGTNYTYYINRTVGSTGANGHEIGVSYAIAMEVAQ